ncbi:ELMO/CED-12 family domain containing protein [Naviculisporaceae sp. PSN 640]
MDQADIPALLSRLASDEDAARKMAVFKLQSSINDPAFADVFIASGGLIILRRLIMSTGGNTLAYSLQSLTRLLEVDMGWDIFEGTGAGDLVERVVELIVTNPLVNILRGAMSILVALVGHSQSGSAARPGGGGGGGGTPGAFGFRALKPAVAVYPQFFEHVIAQLQSADHALCANALMLINALIRDAVSNDAKNGGVSQGGTGEEWSKFIKRLQDLGLIKAVYNLMQSSSLQDLAYPLLEFQSLTKVLLRKWREVRVDLERPEHRRALKGLHLASAPDRRHVVNGGGMAAAVEESSTNGTGAGSEAAKKGGSRKHNPEKWRRLGFETESPAVEFDVAGFLGMMDLTDYVRKNEDGFQKLLLEQSTKPLSERCPVARASLAVTMILYDHFEVDKSDLEDVRGYQTLDPSKPSDRLFHPLLLQWSRLHTAGLHAFFRMWKATGAERDDFDKVAELVRILVEQVVGQAGRTKDVLEVEDDLQEYDSGRLRELQMDLLELSFEDQWGPHLYQVREELKHEALQFVKEQRIRCLLQGSWFTKPQPRSSNGQHNRQDSYLRKGRLYQPWRYAKLSHNRRYLHYADFPEQTAQEPGLDALTEKVDLSTISSVVSNVSAPSEAEQEAEASNNKDPAETSTMSTYPVPGREGGVGGKGSNTKPTTKITIYSFSEDINPPLSSTAGGVGSSGGEPKEEPILTLFPLNHSLASEWLDGLLMLLNQAPITAETNKLITLVSEYGLKIRLLNVGSLSLDGHGHGHGGSGNGVVPSECNPPLSAVRLQVKKKGKNRGRFFWTCPRPREAQCDFFIWDDEDDRADSEHQDNGGPQSAIVTTIGQGAPPLPDIAPTPIPARRVTSVSFSSPQTNHASPLAPGYSPANSTRTQPRIPRNSLIQNRSESRPDPGEGLFVDDDGFYDSDPAEPDTPPSLKRRRIKMEDGEDQYVAVNAAPPPPPETPQKNTNVNRGQRTPQNQQTLSQYFTRANQVARTNTAAQEPEEDLLGELDSDDERRLAEISDSSQSTTQKISQLERREAAAAAPPLVISSSPSPSTPSTPTPRARTSNPGGLPTPGTGNRPSSSGGSEQGRHRGSSQLASSPNPDGDYEITSRIMSLLAGQPISESARAAVRDTLNNHAVRERSVEIGRDWARTSLQTREAKIAELDAKVAGLEAKNSELETQLQGRNATIADLVTEVRGRSPMVAQLEAKIALLEEELRRKGRA